MSGVVFPYNRATFAAVGIAALGAAWAIVELTAQYGALAALSLFPHEDIFFSLELFPLLTIY
jgi:hypothetical protein